MRVCDATCSVGVGDSSSRGLRRSEGTLGSPRAWSVGRITSPQGEACGERALAPPGQLRVAPQRPENWALWAGFVGRTELVFAGVSSWAGPRCHTCWAEGVPTASDVLIKVEAGSGPGRMISALP